MGGGMTGEAWQPTIRTVINTPAPQFHNRIALIITLLRVERLTRLGQTWLGPGRWARRRALFLV
jgi:hypothetical protein